MNDMIWRRGGKWVSEWVRIRMHVLFLVHSKLDRDHQRIWALSWDISIGMAIIYWPGQLLKDTGKRKGVWREQSQDTERWDDKDRVWYFGNGSNSVQECNLLVSSTFAVINSIVQPYLLRSLSIGNRCSIFCNTSSCGCHSQVAVLWNTQMRRNSQMVFFGEAGTEKSTVERPFFHPKGWFGRHFEALGPQLNDVER
jgi:hypothetical protein